MQIEFLYGNVQNYTKKSIFPTKFIQDTYIPKKDKNPKKNYSIKKQLAMKKAERYYLWFLGSQELKDLRDTELVHNAALQVINSHNLSHKSKHKPISTPKVNLEINLKGIKVTQILGQGKCKDDRVVKYFLPAHAIVSSQMHGSDVVLCVFLIYNPETRCPIHLYAYRADTADTARHLNRQLQALVNDQENASKLARIEEKLRANGLISSSGCNGKRSGPFQNLGDHLNVSLGYESNDLMMRDNSYYIHASEFAQKSMQHNSGAIKREPATECDEFIKNQAKRCQAIGSSNSPTDNQLVCGHVGIRNYLKHNPKNPLVLELEQKVRAKAGRPLYIPPQDYNEHDDGVFLSDRQRYSPEPIALDGLPRESLRSNESERDIRIRSGINGTIITEDGIMLADVGKIKDDSLMPHYKPCSSRSDRVGEETDEGICRSTTSNSTSFSSQSSSKERNDELSVTQPLKEAQRDRTKHLEDKQPKCYKDESRYFRDQPGFGHPQNSFLVKNGHQKDKHPRGVNKNVQKSPNGASYYNEGSNLSFANSSLHSDSCAKSLNPTAIESHQSFFNREFKNRLVFH